MNKVFLSIGAVFLLLVIVVSALAINFYSPKEGARANVLGITGNVVNNFEGEKVQINKQQSTFEFEGYAPGKSHVGTFTDWNGNIFLENNKIVGFEGTIKADSVSTTPDRVVTHLKNDDFFDVTKYPEIKFTTTSLRENTMKGILEFRGVKKEIEFPVTITDKKISSEFYIDVTPFNFKYTGINKDVRIKFNFTR